MIKPAFGIEFATEFIFIQSEIDLFGEKERKNDFSFCQRENVKGGAYRSCKYAMTN